MADFQPKVIRPDSYDGIGSTDDLQFLCPGPQLCHVPNWLDSTRGMVYRKGRWCHPKGPMVHFYINT